MVGAVISTPDPATAAVIKSSALAVTVQFACTGIRTLPFGEPVAAALGWTYSRGVKVCHVLTSDLSGVSPMRAHAGLTPTDLTAHRWFL